MRRRGREWVLLLRPSAGPTLPTDNQKPGGQLTSDFTPPTGKAADQGGQGPWNQRLIIATSTNGLDFARTNQVVTDQGAVPDLAQDNNGWIYLYYTGWTVGAEQNKTVVAISAAFSCELSSKAFI